jgi:hypothetical protein
MADEKFDEKEREKYEIRVKDKNGVDNVACRRCYRQYC